MARCLVFSNNCTVHPKEYVRGSMVRLIRRENNETQRLLEHLRVGVPIAGRVLDAYHFVLKYALKNVIK